MEMERRETGSFVDDFSLVDDKRVALTVNQTENVVLDEVVASVVLEVESLRELLGVGLTLGLELSQSGKVKRINKKIYRTRRVYPHTVLIVR